MMKEVWPWIAGVAIGLIIIAFLFAGISNQQDYWTARGSVPRAVLVTHAENLTMVRFPCQVHIGAIPTEKACGFYVWKK
jgi:hypothetical protein